MKNIVTIFVMLISSIHFFGQDSLNMQVYYQHFIDTLTSNYSNAFYSECWGFEYKNNDFAVISSTAGVHFYNVTNPNNCSHVAFVAGELQGNLANWRDYHDYENYLFTVSDVFGGSLQIIDFSELPLSVNKIYDSKVLIETAHNIFIDTATAKLYACGGGRLDGTNFDLAIYDISDPQNPFHIMDYNDVGYIHDCFVRNDTAYLEAPNSQTMYVVNFADTANIEILGSINYYTDMGYTHSGWLTENGNYYVMCDETVGSQIKILDVSDLSDIQEIDVFGSYTSPTSMAHNVIIRNGFAYVSYYNDGVHIFDISNPQDVLQVGFYDTYQLPDTVNYRGVWGVYTFKNGKVIASDRLSGLYVFNANAALNYNVEMPISNFTFVYDSNQMVFTNATANNANNYLWIFSDGQTSTEENPTIIFDQSLANDSVEVCLVASNYAGSDTVCENILVVFAPIASFTFEQGLTYHNFNFYDNTLNNPTSWFWDFGVGQTSIEQNPNFSFDTFDGNLNVCLTATNAAGESTFCINEFYSSTLNVLSNKIKIYPNPVKNMLTINGITNNFEVKIYNSKMQLLANLKNENKIDFKDFENGLYFIDIETNNFKTIKKVVK